jgi:polyisoprenoid-binding protein YceI
VSDAVDISGSPTTASESTSLTLDPIHSSLAFSLTAMGVSVFRADFAAIQASLEISEGQASLKASVPVDSISVHGPAEFRAHLLGTDFFAAEAHPEAAFESEPFPVVDGETSIVGQLTLRGVAKTVEGTAVWSRELTDPSGKSRRHLTLSGVVDRREFGMTWNMELPRGDTHLGNDVTLEAELGFATAA